MHRFRESQLNLSETLICTTRSWLRQVSLPPPLLHCPSGGTLSTVTVSCCGCGGWTERMTWRPAPPPNTSQDDTSGPSLRKSFSANLHLSLGTPMRWGCSRDRELHSGMCYEQKLRNNMIQTFAISKSLNEHNEFELHNLVALPLSPMSHCSLKDKTGTSE